MNVIKNKIISISICLIILVSCICIPASAATSLYIPILPDDWGFYNGAYYSSMAPIGSATIFGSTTDIRFGIQYAPNAKVAAYAVPIQTRSSAAIGYNLYFIEDIQGTLCYQAMVNGGYQGSRAAFTPYEYEEETYYLCNASSININSYMSDFTIDTSSPYITVVESLNDAFYDYLHNSPPSPKPLNYTLPAGNAIFIEYYGNCNYSIQTASDSPGGMNPSNVNGIKSGYTSTISSFNYNSSFLDYTSFSGYGNTTVLGQYVTYTYNGNTAIEAPEGVKYLVIVNPMLNQMNDTGKTNPHITITANSVNKFYIIPMNTQLNNGEWDSSGNNNDIIYGEYDADSQEWYTNDGNGEPSNPINGGLTISGEPKTITEWLETIVNTLTDFFKGPVNAINILIQNLSGFVNSLKSLYMWLPSPVYSLLTSAIMVAITIGVIKIFI